MGGVTSTDGSNPDHYNVVEPARKLPASERKELYNLAKKAIASLSDQFQQKVHFDDQNLKIGFDYDVSVLWGLASHENLWVIFSKSLGYDRNDLCGIYGPTAESTRFDPGKYESALTNMIKEAEDFFATFESKRSQDSSPPQTYKNMKDLAIDLIKDSKGAAIGELHEDTSSKEFLISQMETFVEQGVKVLFMEIFSDSLQKDLDHYLEKSTPIDEIPVAIRYGALWKVDETQGEKQDVGNETAYLEVLKAAKRAGIERVVGIDSYLTRSETTPRLTTLNYQAKQVIEKEMPKDGKFLVLCGGGHATTTDNIPGFSQIFDIPCLIAENTNADRGNQTVLKKEKTVVAEMTFDYAVFLTPEDKIFLQS